MSDGATTGAKASVGGVKLDPPRFLSGPGAAQVRRVQAAIRRMALALPDTEAIPGAVVLAGAEAAPSPAVPSTPARLAIRQPVPAAPHAVAVRVNAAPAVAASGGDGSGDGQVGVLEDEFRSFSNQMLVAAQNAGHALQESPTPIEHTASFDFSEYAYLRDVDAVIGTGADDPAMTHAVAAFMDGASAVIGEVVETFLPSTVVVPEPSTAARRAIAMHWLEPGVPQAIAGCVRLFAANAAGQLYEMAALIGRGYTGDSGDTFADVLGALREWLIPRVQGATRDAATGQWSFVTGAAWASSASEIRELFFTMHPDAQWGTVVPPQPLGYPFSLYPAGLVNFGLQLVYRQEWRPLGTQSGEIVRTIPLAPHQVERISTKTVVTDRTARTEESATSTESSSESDVTTRDGSEVVTQASKNFKWHADANGSFSLGPFSAGASGGMSGERASSSRDTKTNLNESVARTATRTTRTVKVVVSSEHSSTEELSRSSELTNANDDIAVTYVFSKLLRQYEISTALVEAVSVVFVPEAVPAASDINEAWVRRYDWVLRDALLDASFGDDLAEIAREVELSQVSDEEHAAAGAAASAAQATMGSFSTLPGRLPDIFGTPHLTYHDLAARQRTLVDAAARRHQRRERLFQHIRENILHYMRAIWSSEDAEQRWRRYAQIFVPTRFTFAPDPDGQGQPGDLVPGGFVPVYDSDSMRRLTDLIHPSGPIAYCANYAVFQLRRAPALVNLNQALSVLRAGYARWTVQVGPDTAPTPTAAWVAEPRHTVATYRVRAGADLDNWQAQVTLPDGSSWSTNVATDAETGIVSFDGCGLQFAGDLPTEGTEYEVRIAVTDELEDPELRALRIERPLPRAADEDAVYSAVLTDMVATLPEVGAHITEAQAGGGFAGLTDDQQRLVRDAYHAFLLRREHTRRFLMDTNNLLVDVEVGATPTLEDYKRLHRTIDVLKEVETLSTKHLENVRRAARLAAQQLGDPDIENVSVVEAGTGVDLDVPVTPPPGPPPPP